MILAVEGGDAFAVLCAADDDMVVFNVAAIKGMHGLTGFQHYEVCNVDNVVDGSHTCGLKAALHPVGRLFNAEISNNAAVIAVAKVIVLNVYLDVIVDVSSDGFICGHRGVEGLAQHHRYLSRNA